MDRSCTQCYPGLRLIRSLSCDVSVKGRSLPIYPWLWVDVLMEVYTSTMHLFWNQLQWQTNAGTAKHTSETTTHTVNTGKRIHQNRCNHAHTGDTQTHPCPEKMVAKKGKSNILVRKARNYSMTLPTPPHLSFSSSRWVETLRENSHNKEQGFSKEPAALQETVGIKYVTSSSLTVQP